MKPMDTAIIIILSVFCGFCIGFSACDLMRNRESDKRRRELGERFRRDCSNYWRKRFPEGNYQHWTDPEYERELMQSIGITEDDIRKALEDLQ